MVPLNRVVKEVVNWFACQRSELIILVDVEDERQNQNKRTTDLFSEALSNIEVVKEWEYCFIAWNQNSARRLSESFAYFAKEKGFVVSRCSVGQVVIEGAIFNFIGKNVLNQWQHGRLYFSDIVEDNEVTEREEQEKIRTRIIPKRLYGNA